MGGDGAERYSAEDEIDESRYSDAPAETDLGKELAEHDGIHESTYVSFVSLEGASRE